MGGLGNVLLGGAEAPAEVREPKLIVTLICEQFEQSWAIQVQEQRRQVDRMVWDFASLVQLREKGNQDLRV